MENGQAMTSELPGAVLVRLVCGHDMTQANGDRCIACDRHRLPDGLVTVRETPEWTADTVPPALLRDHQTSTWAELVVHEGSVCFIEEASGWTCRAHPGHPAAIVPNRLHRIEPSADARFFVRFLRERGFDS